MYKVVVGNFCEFNLTTISEKEKKLKKNFFSQISIHSCNAKWMCESVSVYVISISIGISIYYLSFLAVVVVYPFKHTVQNKC